jgi:restriction system protein
MEIPTYDRLIEPLLRVLGEAPGAVRARDARDRVAQRIALPVDARAVLLPSGKQGLFDNRVGWAHDRLKRAGLSASVVRGTWCLTDAGRSLAALHPGGLPDALVRRLAAIDEDSTLGVHPGDAATLGTSASAPSPRALSPLEQLLAAHEALRATVAIDLLAQLRAVSPSFFERVVLDVLHAMGYGASRSDIQAVGQSGDGGIDGIIHLDKLGLQRVYVQAKRWSGANPVGRPEIQAFFGALSERGAQYGVFITTGAFSRPAHEAAQKFDNRMVLVDGDRLVRLMMDHGVGVSAVQRVEILRVDSDYFAED